MKSSSFLEYVLYDVFSESDPITTRAMMGGFILYYEGAPFALIHDEGLYFKGSKILKDWYLDRGGKQFEYKRKDKTSHLFYFLAPDLVYEDEGAKEQWLATALSAGKAA